MKAGKLTGRVLASVCAKGIGAIQKHHQAGLTPRGHQSVKKLMNHGVSTQTIPLDGDTKLFDRVARKWNVDYAFHKVGPNKYMLFFKAGQVDAITHAFADYTKRMARRRQPTTILNELKKFRARTQEKSQQKERTREAEHGDR